MSNTNKSNADPNIARHLDKLFAEDERKASEFINYFELLGEVINKSTISHHRKGLRPINDDYARRYAQWFQEPLENFSPQLARDVVNTLNDHLEGRITVLSLPKSLDDINSRQEFKKPSHNELTIPRLNVRGSMGKGLMLPDPPDVIQNISVTMDWMATNLDTFTSYKNLSVITGHGKCMEGLYASGDLLFIDTGVRAFERDGVYFFRIEDEGHIKTLQKIPTRNAIRVVHANKNYENYDLTPDMNVEIMAKVVGVWRKG